MYADDLILLSTSISHLQKLIDICVKEFNAIGMEINIKKSCCMRIGERHACICQPMLINNIPLEWVKEMKYLGITILASKKMTFNLQRLKQKFLAAVNGIFDKIGVKASPFVLILLINSFCLPILLYVAESLFWSMKFEKA